MESRHDHGVHGWFVKKGRTKAVRSRVFASLETLGDSLGHANLNKHHQRVQFFFLVGSDWTEVLGGWFVHHPKTSLGSR